MKLNDSRYLLDIRPVAKSLVDTLCARYAYASLLAVDSCGKRYRIARSGVSAGQDELYTSRGFVVRVFDAGHYAEYSFNALSEADIPAILAGIETALQEGTAFPDNRYEAPADEPLTFSASTEYEVDPEALGDEAILALLRRVREKGLAVDERLLDCGVMAEYQKYSKLFLSRNRDMMQNVMWTSGAVFLLAARGEEIKEYFEGYSGLGGTEALDRMENEVTNVAAKALELLDSEPIKPGEYTCICAPDVTGMIVHEAFGHGVEMDMFVKKRALAEEYVGKQVASPLVTMHDGAAGMGQTATFFFDDEGTLAQDTVVIENGILKSGICDAHSALARHFAPTGNGRRESYERKAYTRMTNTYFTGGTDTLEDMLRSVDYGFLLEDASSGMEDPKNWGIQCMVNVAREIRDGKLTGRIFSPVVLTGYVPDLLCSISMMSETPILSGTGFCGKGHKEWVKVSDGGPYIKATIRLG